MSLGSLGLKYEDFNSYPAKVELHGNFKLQAMTGEPYKFKGVELTKRSEEYGQKSFSEFANREKTTGFAVQKASLTFNLIVHRDGMIELNLNAYSGSWTSTSCASAEAYITSIEFTI